MKHFFTFIMPLFLFYNSVKPMRLQQAQKRVTRQTAKAALMTPPAKMPQYIEIIHFLDAVTVKQCRCNEKEQPITEEKRVICHKNSTLLLLDGQKGIHKVTLDLSTSPNHVYFYVKQKNNSNNRNNSNNNNNSDSDSYNDSVHYGDSIAIKDNLKSMSIVNETTGTTLAHFPKENSSLRLGLKIFGPQVVKKFTLFNTNVSYVIVKGTDYQHPIQGQVIPLKKSKLIGSQSCNLLQGHSTEITMGSNNDGVVDSTIELDIYQALQKIKIRPSYDKIQNNDTICIKCDDDGYIILSKVINHMVEETLVRVCTPLIHEQIPL